jgi:hypothetical protein
MPARSSRESPPGGGEVKGLSGGGRATAIESSGRVVSSRRTVGLGEGVTPHSHLFGGAVGSCGCDGCPILHPLCLPAGVGIRPVCTMELPPPVMKTETKTARALLLAGKTAPFWSWISARNGAKWISAGLVWTVAMAVSLPGAAAQMVDLGSASEFAVLAGAGITIGASGTTTITGDIGSYPTATITGTENLDLDGTNHGGDAVTQAAKTDLDEAYDDAAGRTPTTTYSPIYDLGGQTLGPGVYNNPSSFGITGILTLDAGGDPNAVWIFQAGSTLITASGSQVALINGAQASRVFWQVGTSATLGTGTDFAGTLLVAESITLVAGASVEGRLLALNGAVTLGRQCGRAGHRSRRHRRPGVVRCQSRRHPGCGRDQRHRRRARGAAGRRFERGGRDHHRCRRPLPGRDRGRRHLSGAVRPFHGHRPHDDQPRPPGRRRRPRQRCDHRRHGQLRRHRSVLHRRRRDQPERRPGPDAAQRDPRRSRRGLGRVDATARARGLADELGVEHGGVLRVPRRSGNRRRRRA